MHSLTKRSLLGRSRKLSNRTDKLISSVFRLVCVKQESLLDSVCPYLLQLILQGSPGNICDYEPSLSLFFQVRSEMVVQGKRDQSILPWPTLSYEYQPGRGMEEMMVEVKCKLTVIKIAP